MIGLQIDRRLDLGLRIVRVVGRPFMFLAEPRDVGSGMSSERPRPGTKTTKSGSPATALVPRVRITVENRNGKRTIIRHRGHRRTGYTR